MRIDVDAVVACEPAFARPVAANRHDVRLLEEPALEDFSTGAVALRALYVLEAPPLVWAAVPIELNQPSEVVMGSI